jgi:FkbM family methyltransferase
MDVWIVKETCLDRDYERVGVPVEDGWTVIDIGAGIGDFTLDTALRQPNSTIHAYEPFPESFDLLEENALLNNVQNVRTFNEAVDAGTDAVQLALTGAAVQHSTAIGVASGSTITATAVTLGQVLDRVGCVCNLLKMDCEGAEYGILFSAGSQALEGIERIVLEYHDNVVNFSHEDLVEFLREKGYRVRCYPSRVQPDLGLIFAVRPQNDTQHE